MEFAVGVKHLSDAILLNKGMLSAIASNPLYGALFIHIKYILHVLLHWHELFLLHQRMDQKENQSTSVYHRDTQCESRGPKAMGKKSPKKQGDLKGLEIIMELYKLNSSKWVCGDPECPYSCLPGALPFHTLDRLHMYGRGGQSWPGRPTEAHQSAEAWLVHSGLDHLQVAKCTAICSARLKAACSFFHQWFISCWPNVNGGCN